MSAPEPERLVFFDGVCGLCDRAVAFLFARDRRRVLRFAPLQGETAARLLPENLRTPPLDTMIYRRAGVLFMRSDAALRLAGELGGMWRLALLLLVIPRPVRDAAYKLVAARRYAVFGRKDACRLPTAAEKPYFLP